MADSEIEALLQKTIGLKATSIGRTTLDRSVQRRMKILAIADRHAYVEMLKSSPHELKELIEEVVIPETWFFRDREPFRAMIRYLVTQWAPRHKNTIFRVLSVPCSTGEEPYSIAMSLLSSGWPAEKFTVHAVDISGRSICRAKEGIYSEHSFRGMDSGDRSRYFERNSKYHILNKNVRKQVHFHNGNVLNNIFMQGLGLFDVIFFRNVLIYFDTPARQRAISTLSGLLADDGILFVGHAEANLCRDFPFTPAPYPQSFAFYKKTTPQSRPETRHVAEPERSEPPKNPPARSIPRKPAEKKPGDLGQARQLADNGKLREARLICEEYLHQRGPSAEAFFLLGIIHDAAGSTEQAEKLFRKAVYLDPVHEEALFFLAFLAEKKGHVKESESLQQRIKRLHTNSAAGDTKS